MAVHAELAAIVIDCASPALADPEGHLFCLAAA